MGKNRKDKSTKKNTEIYELRRDNAILKEHIKQLTARIHTMEDSNDSRGRDIHNNQQKEVENQDSEVH